MDDKELPIWGKRLGYLIQECFDFIGAIAAHHRENLVVRGVPIRESPTEVSYRYAVRGNLLPNDADEKLRDIFGRARSVLDIAMFNAVKSAAVPALTAKQERNTYFPISADEAGWKSACGQPHMQALSQAQRDNLRTIQPFVTNNSAITWFSDEHNADKHQRPLTLSTILDPEIVMFFGHLEPQFGTVEYWIDWADPLPAVEQKVIFARYRTVQPIIHAGIEDVPVSLGMWFDGQWRDMQHLLWDLLEFTARACELLDNGDTSMADAMKDYFGHEREQLNAFNKMMLTGDPKAEAEWLRLADQEAAAPAPGASMIKPANPYTGPTPAASFNI
ncbi:hypothetical protein [Clavibacter nebraskensis]|uniref:Uncharacterized protein n=1 Tax=Clavibacter nebraskensis TaxID=31963 RepID=A0ABY4MPW7_9MICO|nr:hypothetical protein [Clavibacter nebraskensis]QKO03342.1 hypothetical protein EGX35_14650 [Clavibacter nebraskensis]QLL36512.1 hypothetical protein EGX36_14695 [Clavibacter nebraskensis]QLL36615.1 hypothetical protein EGX37_14650 [Clavibacter nebraskensis]UKF28403.1 hypothetical protein FGQ65_09470 [Clavibacter nebraskensis]UQB05077.1 hypothetical protein LIV34_000057 [Clavibacter nebraskensis]